MATFPTEPVRDFFRLSLLVLLLSSVACQRASFPVQASSDYSAQFELSTPHEAVDQSSEGPIVQNIAARTSPMAKAANLVPCPKRRARSHHALASPPLAASSVHYQLPTPRHQLPTPRRALTLRRSPSMSENTKFGLLFFGGGALLVALGLVLLIGVAGWLAVLGGIVLVLIGLGLALFWLYAIGLSKNMGH